MQETEEIAICLEKQDFIVRTNLWGETDHTYVAYTQVPAEFIKPKASRKTGSAIFFPEIRHYKTELVEKIKQCGLMMESGDSSEIECDDFLYRVMDRKKL